MRKSKFSEAQTIRILKEAETGKSIREICREHGISSRNVSIAGNRFTVGWRCRSWLV